MFSATITKTTESNFVSFGISSYTFAMPTASSEVEVLTFFHFYIKIYCVVVWGKSQFSVEAGENRGYNTFSNSA